MSKTIYIFRHGKSGWEYGEVADYDRPLKERGIREAYKTAHQLGDKAKPDLLMSSFANRAMHTATIAAGVWGIPYNQIIIRSELYLADIYQLLNQMSSVDDNVQCLALFGHNPGFTDLYNFFAKQKIENIPTATCGIIELDTKSWKNIKNVDTIKEEIVTSK